MARIPFVSYGQDDLTRKHRLVGFTSFTLLLAHLVLITFGYAAEHHARSRRHLRRPRPQLPRMLLAFAATVALTMVVVTSIRRAAGAGYESWHLIHLYAYLGAGLAVPHQLWTGADFLPAPPPRSSGGGCGWPRCSPCSPSGSVCRCGARCGTGWSSPRSSPSNRV